MALLINIGNHPNTGDLMKAVSEQFSKGIDVVNVTDGTQIVGAFFSPEAMKKEFTRKIAEQWMEHPEMLDQLTTSLEEEAEDWDD